MWQIEPVSSDRYDKAIRFLAGGRERDTAARTRADVLRNWASQYPPQAVRLWWARRRLRPLAAAMVIETPGRIGMLVHSIVSLSGVNREALVEVIRAISRDALAGGLTMAQSLLKRYEADDVAVLLEAGYFQLAELVYMTLDLSGAACEEVNDNKLTWRSYDQFTVSQLAELISVTYEDSLDCPAISTLRDADDIIETHKSNGIFAPRSWWIAEYEGSPAGCILVNDCRDAAASEVVYMGVAPQHRGKGLARKLLRRAGSDVKARGKKSLTLAVDAQNRFARKAYDDEGFIETARRLAYVIIGERR
ncbi:MAG: GNAT family N-acetyltransferase [Phycisphaerae bacterium]|nr:GNAT family N-acetyltransferase [Phycisphaerae bacterium]